MAGAAREVIHPAHPTGFKNLSFKIRHRFFILKRKWLCQPFFHHFYPKSGFTRRLIACLFAFLILVPAIFLLLRPDTTEAAWYSDTWRFRKLLTINSSKVPSTQTNFPVLVSITDAGLKSHAQGSGNDILFTSSDGSTKLSHEIETFATGSGKLNAWVKIPSLSATTDTKIYMYYGNPSSPSQQDPTNVWDSNFKGVWHLKENPAGTAPQMKDSTTNANNGTSNGSMTSSQQTAGQINGSLSFDGTDDYVNIANESNFDFERTQPFSFCAWIKPDTVTPQMVIAGKAQNGSGFRGWYFIQYDSSGNKDGLFLNIANTEPGNRIAVEVANILTAGTWQYACFTYDGSSQASGVKIYLNGTSRTITTTHEDNLSGTILNNIAQQIGTFDSSYSPYDGAIDDVRLYDYALSPKQITSVMNAGHPAVGSPVGSAIAHWKFDEGQGTIANNSGSAGSSINGTLTNMASPATAASGWSNEGKFGKALNFDKTDDYVNAGSAPALDNITEKTVCAWIYPKSIGELNGGSNYGEIVTKFNSDGWALELSNQDGGQQGLYYWHGFTASDGYWRTPNGKGPPLNSWSHVCVAYNNSSAENDPTFYVNGVSPGLVEYSTPSGNSDDESGGNLLIGNLPDASQTFDGTIDEVKIYNYALTADEIKVEYNQGKSQVLGSLSTDPDGITASNSAARAYCPPGDTEGNCAAGLNPAPVGHCAFDGRKGTSAFDISGNNNTGTLTNGPKWAPGKLGQSIRFDGVDDSVAIADHSSLNVSTNFTLSAWIRRSSTNSLDMIYQSGTSSNYWGLTIQQNVNNKLNLFERSIADNYSSTAILDTNWHHVAVIKNGDVGANITFYLDGKFDGSATTGSIAAPSGGKLIGNWSESNSQAFSGNIDDVRIYNYARTPAQIAWDYNQGKPLAHYKLDECTGTRAFDSSGNNLHGTLNIGASGSQTTAGNCTTVNTATAWYHGREGKYNSSLSFDGTDDYVQVNGLLGSPANITLSTWVNLDTPDTSGAEVISLGDSVMLRMDQPGFGTEGIFYNGSTWVGVSTGNYAGTGWHHLAYIVDDTNNSQKLYVDGVEKGSSATSDSISYTLGANTLIGKHANGSASFDFNGRIDDVRIYNYALNATQIRTVLNEGAAIRFGPLTGSP